MTTLTNPYLQGSYAPVHEEVTATELAVSGSIPEQLCGRYLRNGPNPATPQDPASYHWFLGDGMVHGIRLRDGRAEWYRNRWVRSAAVARALGEEPKPGPVHSGWDFASNTNVIGHAGRTFAIVEAGPLPYELTDELDTIGPCDFDGTLAGGYTAHPKRDPQSGELYAVSYFFGWGDDVDVSIIDPGGHVRSSRRVTMGGPVSVHDCAITERSLVLLDLPVTFRMEAAASGASFPYRWQEDYRSRVGLLPRDGDSTEVVWHDVEPCYVFHIMNAYDEPGGGVVLDVVRHPSMFRTHLLGPSEGAPTLERWHLDGRGGAVKEERLDDRGQDSHASTSEWWAGRTATATPPPSASPTTLSARSRSCCATTSSGARRSNARSGAGPPWERRSSCHGPKTPLRTTGGCSPSRTRLTAAGRPSISSTPVTRQARRRRSWNCPSGCPSAFTAIGSRTGSEPVSV